MINPHLLRATSKRWNDPRFAGWKVYLAVFVPSGHRASDVQEYAERPLYRWCRLYDEMIVNMAASADGPAQPSLEPEEA